MSNAPRGWWMVLIAAACLAGMVLYFQRVVIPHQIGEAAGHQTPRGNLSDLYPRWFGARELLLRGRDPYSAELTREIQIGYYGRPIDLSRPNDPIDEQRFAYPVYVVFLLAPTIGLSFDVVQKAAWWILLVITAAGVPLWLRLLKWSAPTWVQLSLMLLTIGSPAVMQGLKLRQLSLLVSALVFVAVLLIASDKLASAGVLLAMATIKPQLLVLLLLWLALWTISDWRNRYRLAASFLLTMMVLVAASERYLPHWIPQFWDAIHQYQRYTGAASVIDKMISPSVGMITGLLSLALSAAVAWKERHAPANSEAFVRMLCLVLAITVLVIPTFAPYNQILLLPAVLFFARQWPELRTSMLATKVVLGLTVLVIVWPWITSIGLAGLSFLLPAQSVQRFWTVPFWTVWLIPVAVVALMLVVAYRGSFPNSGKAIPA